MSEKGQPLPYPLDACAGCCDLTEQLAQALLDVQSSIVTIEQLKAQLAAKDAEMADWRAKFQKAIG